MEKYFVIVPCLTPLSFFFFFTRKNDGYKGREKAINEKKVAERTRLMTVPSSVPTTAALNFRSVTARHGANFSHDHRR